MQKPPSTWGLPGSSPRQREPGHLALVMLFPLANWRKVYPRPAYYPYIWKQIVSWECKWGVHSPHSILPLFPQTSEWKRHKEVDDPLCYWTRTAQLGVLSTCVLEPEDETCGGLHWRRRRWRKMTLIVLPEGCPLPRGLGDQHLLLMVSKSAPSFCLYSHFGRACPRRTRLLRIRAWPCFPPMSVWLLHWSPISSLLFSFLYHVANSLAYCEKSPKSAHILKHAVARRTHSSQEKLFPRLIQPFISEEAAKLHPSLSLTWSSSQRKHPVPDNVHITPTWSFERHLCFSRGAPPSPLIYHFPIKNNSWVL